MSPAYKKHAVFIAFIVLLASGIFSCSFSDGRSRESYEALLKDLRLLRQINAEFNENILLTRNLVLKNFDPLVRTASHMREVSRRLDAAMGQASGSGLFLALLLPQASRAYETHGQEIARLFGEYLEIQRGRLGEVEAFKASHSVLKNSLDYLPSAFGRTGIGELAAKTPSRAHNELGAAAAELHDLYQNVLLFRAASQLGLERVIAQKIAALRSRDFSRFPELQKGVQGFLDHCEIIAARNAAIIGQMRSLIQKEDKDLLAQIYDHVNARHGLLEKQTDVFKTLLFILTALLIGYVAFLFKLLYKTMRDLSQSNAMLKKADKAKSLFLANMSHEIRTPLNGIIGLTQLLAEGRVLPEQRESLNAVLKSSESLLFLLNDILDFSKIEAGEIVFENAPFSLKDTLTRVIDLMSSLASKKGIVIEFHYNPQAPATVTGDSVRVGQIVTNLLSNALKFTEKGSVTISVSTGILHEGGMQDFIISIADTGIGIPEDKKGTLFKQFSQVDATMTRKYGGTGLGLAISKKLAEAMKGDVSFVSEYQKGSVFTVRLPLQVVKEPLPAAIVPAAAAQGPRDAALFSRLAVLVVDDHPVNRLVASKMLRKMGFEDIEEAETGEDALRRVAARNDRFDLILMDCQMPEMDGFDACRKIRETELLRKAERKPIIAITAHAMEGDMERCLSVGMDDYLSKPIRPDKLYEAARRWALKGRNDPQRPHVNDDSAGKPPEAAATQPVQMHLLELYTEGEAEQEKALAEVYLSAGSQTISLLEKHLSEATQNADWRNAAHKLKGSSAQIGAMKMADLCLKAENIYESGADDKTRLLAQIESEFRRIEAFFKHRLQSA